MQKLRGASFFSCHTEMTPFRISRAIVAFSIFVAIFTLLGVFKNIDKKKNIQYTSYLAWVYYDDG